MQGRSQTFSFGGATGGASFATRELSMVCVGLQCSDMTSGGKFWGGHWGKAKILRGQWPPWHPLSSAPAQMNDANTIVIMYSTVA